MIIKFKDLVKLQEEDTVYVSGIFDLIHVGHVRLFKRIKNIFPDNKLVVGVASDKRVRVKKGPDRPILKQNERLEIVDSLKHVDYVFIYPCVDNGITNPIYKIIEVLKPTYLVTKLKYSKDFPALEKQGVKPYIISRTKGKSTTKIIKGMKKS